MTIKEAIKLTKQAVKQTEAISKLSDALQMLEGKTDVIAGLIKRKEAFEKEVEAAKARLIVVSDETNAKIKATKSNTRTILKNQEEQIKIQTAKYHAILKATSDAVRDRELQLNKISAELIAERTANIKILDQHIKEKGDKLRKIETDFDELRKKVVE